jgi:hypothetical protein
MDFSKMAICPPGGPCPWHDFVEAPFEIPSLVADEVYLDRSAVSSQYVLKETQRAALGALAVRHESSDSDSVSAYLPVRFAEGQMDLIQFANTVMLEDEKASGKSVAQPKSLNDVMSIWTFGGMDRNGVVYDELWRGELRHDAKGAYYSFARVKYADGPEPRAGAVLLADVSGQRLILLGGVDQKGQLRNDVWTFDLADARWHKTSVKVPRRVGLYGATYEASGSHGHVVGGLNRKGQVAALWRLDFNRLSFRRDRNKDQRKVDRASSDGAGVNAGIPAGARKAGWERRDTRRSRAWRSRGVRR